MDTVWERLREKLDRISTGYPKTEDGSELPFLKKIFSEEDAEFFVRFKEGPQEAEQVATHFDMDLNEAKTRLEEMSDKHLLWWQRIGGKKYYRVVPYVYGVWEYNVEYIEYSDAKNMNTLYRSGFADALMDYGLPLLRVIPISPEAVRNGDLLPIDDAEQIIRSAKRIVATDCACRAVRATAKSHCECTDNMNVCLSFDDMATYYMETNCGNPRELNHQQALATLKTSLDKGRFLQVSHTSKPAAMCSCPTCHCGILMAAKMTKGATFENWSNYTCIKYLEGCINCGKCADVCPYHAHQKDENSGNFHYVSENCIGCGLCVMQCPEKALLLTKKPEDKLTIPVDEQLHDHQLRMSLERHRIDALRTAATGNDEISAERF